MPHAHGRDDRPRARLSRSGDAFPNGSLLTSLSRRLPSARLARHTSDSKLRQPTFEVARTRSARRQAFCSYLSYDSLRDLAKQKHLAPLADTVLDEYEEFAEDSA